jgi:hypothetical protein
MEVFIVSVVNYLVGLSSANPKLISILAILYLVGVVLKIVRTAIESYVLQSPSLEDDAKLATLEASQPAKILFFVTDLLIRFKKPVA